MYEYAAIAIEPNNLGDSWLERKIAVGPSAPPMIPIEAASLRLKSIPGTQFSANAPSNVAKIPNWAAPPNNAVLGLANIGPKSVMAPMPIKISSGKIPVVIPIS